MTKFLPFLFGMLAASSAYADAPRVVVDIAPVHSLVAQVMEGVGAPELLVDPVASPHSFALRPSQAANLQEADIVFLTSFALTPWLEAPLDSLSKEARKVEMMLSGETLHHDYRISEEDGEDGHEDDHGHDHEGEHGETLLDPHGWLDPLNAKLWLAEIATTLGEVDSSNAALYQQNATAAIAALEILIAEITAQTAPLEGKHYMVLHDAFQYFDRRFDLDFAGSISLGDATAPSPARLSHVQDELREHSVGCILKEPQQSDRLIYVVLEGTDTKVGELDGLGARLSPGPNLYSELLQGLSDSFVSCLGD